MIKKISVNHYRKLKNVDIELSEGVNVLSGTNGTCKTSLLHIISNSCKAINKSCDWLKDPSCLDTIKKVNSIINPKIETLAKGDKQYSDPAYGHRGALYTVEYFNDESLAFRRHNSKAEHRYAVKPYYTKDANQKLPYCLTIYLGLARLFSFGEFQQDDSITSINRRLPNRYLQEIASLYQNFTNISIESSTPQRMGDIKVRSDFTTNFLGVDSNTISAGEDNLYIILTALVSLKYYYESIQSTQRIESILLIDEVDASLHPSYQNKLIDLFRDFSQQYKIQIIFTTHSLSLIEYALKKKDNVVYLIDNITNVINMEFPDIYKIKRHLYNLTSHDIYKSKVIPIFTEDKEARIFLRTLFDYYSDTKPEFRSINSYFYFVDANFGAESLKNIFSDTYLLKSTMQAICILDGDKHSNKNMNIITLPGSESPEKLIMNYSIQLLDNDDPFWKDEKILEINYGKVYYLHNIKPDIDGISQTLRELRQQDESTHGVERTLRKKVFEKHQRFFELLFMHWVHNPENEDLIERFYLELYAMFKKVAEFHGINPKEWKLET